MIPQGPGKAMPGVVVAEPAVPVAPRVYYAVRGLVVTGNQIEDGSGIAVPSVLAHVLALGGTPPVFSDDLLCEWTGTRWVAERFGVPSGGVFIPGCPCTSVPRTLTVAVSKPSSNFHILQPCTLQYNSPIPPQFSSLAIGGFAWLSTTSFTDDLSSNPFWYYFSCNQGYYVLSRAYPATPAGPAFLDSIRYKWLAGFFGNDCSPFSLQNGSIFAGGDPTCKVTVTG